MQSLSLARASLGPDIAVLSAGRDKPYALGLAAALIEKEVPFEFIGSDGVDDPLLHASPFVIFRNIRGDQSDNAPLRRKAIRVFVYYARLVGYAFRARPTIFHILWNNKFEWFDRTLLMVFYRLCGRKIVYTAHNVNAGNRDDNDSFMNRSTLRVQYRLSHHIFVHTQQMSKALQTQFDVPPEKVTVIPFGMNSTVPDTSLSCSKARVSLGLNPDDRVLLFYGNIAPYKGVEYLVRSLEYLPKDGCTYRLLIAGRLKCTPKYWQGIQESLARLNVSSMVLSRIEYIPDEETEIYFKAADVLVLPYTYVFQSGVLFLGYNFGLPVLAADVGSLREDIEEGKTGYVFQPKDPKDIARTIEMFFESRLYYDLSARRQEIRAFAAERYSWSHVASKTLEVYRQVLATPNKTSQHR